MKTLEQVYRQMKLKEVSDLYYGSDKARDTYAKDTPGQTPGVDHDPVQHQHKPELAMDGVPMPGGELKKPQFQKGIKDGGPVTKDNKLSEKKDGIKNCGCGKEPCETYGSKEEQMKAMNEAMKDKCGEGEYWCNKDQKCKPIPDGMKVDKDGILVKEDTIDEAGRWDQTSTGRAYRALSPEEKKRRALKNALKDAAKRMTGDDEDYTKTRKIGKQGIGRLKATYKGRKTRREAVEDVLENLEMAYLDEMSPVDRKKAAAKIFQMHQDKKANQALAQKSSAAAKAARADAKSYKTSDDSHLDAKPKPPMKKRGRGERDLPHIVSQLRGVVDTKDGSPSQVKFKDGSTKSVKPKHAASWLKKHDSAKPQQKLDMYKSHDSHSSFKKYAKEAVEWDYENEASLIEGSKPNNPKLWAAKKAQAKAKFDVYPSAYANGWAAKQYKKAGGTWRSESVEHDISELSTRTLTKYIQKASNPVGKKSAITYASKGAYKLGKSDKYDLDAGEKDDRKAFKRGKGIMRAAQKIQRKTYGNMTKPTPYGGSEMSKNLTRKVKMKVDSKGNLAKEAVDKEDTKGLKKLVKGLKGSSQAHLDQAKKLGKMISDEKMSGQEYRTQMDKVKSKNPSVRKAVTAVLDKKGKVSMKHPDVDAAKKYMKTEYYDRGHGEDPSDATPKAELERERSERLKKMMKDKKKAQPKPMGEATYDQVLKHRYRSDSSADSPTHQAYLGRDKERGMKTYKVIPGSNLDSKKGKMKAIKKQLKRRPKDYGITGKHDPAYPANQGEVQLQQKRQKSKKTAGQYTQTPGKNLEGDNRDKAVADRKRKEKQGRDAIKKAGGIKNYLKQKQAARNKAAMQKESMAAMADIHTSLKGNNKPKVKKHLDRANVYKKKGDMEGYYHHTQKANDHAKPKPKGDLPF